MRAKCALLKFEHSAESELLTVLYRTESVRLLQIVSGISAARSKYFNKQTAKITFILKFDRQTAYGDLTDT